MAEMKADGVDYEERLDRIADITYPRPLGGAARRGVRPVLRGGAVGARLRARAQIGAARHAGDRVGLQGIRGALRHRPQRGHVLALPVRRVPRARPHGAVRQARRSAERHHRVAGPCGAFGRLQPWWTNGRRRVRWKTCGADRCGCCGARPSRPDCARAEFAVPSRAPGRARTRSKSSAIWIWSGASAPAWQDALDAFYEAHEEVLLDADARSSAYFVLDESDERAHTCGTCVRSSTMPTAIAISASWPMSTWTPRRMRARSVLANYRVGFAEDILD